MNPLPTTQPRLRRWGSALFAVVSAAFSSLATAETVVWSDAFDDGGASSRWSVSAGTWQIGIPASGPGVAHSGLRCAATNLGGDYTEPADTRLVRNATFVVPAASENPRLRFWQWFSFNSMDSGTLEVKEVGATDWVAVAPVLTCAGNAWSRGGISLSNFAGKTVQVAFHFQATNNYQTYVGNTHGVDVSAGWYIDDVSLATGPQVLNSPETFEAGFGDWYADGGLWEAGAPTSGPGAAHGGSNCVGTVLGGDYPEYVGWAVNGENANGVSSRLLSPAFIVPAANLNPRLRFWQWFSFNSLDSGTLEVREVGTTDWVVAGPVLTCAGNAWSRGDIDLTAFAGKTVQVAFHFQAANYLNYSAGNTHGVDVSAGWYIDDVSLATGPQVLNSPETFEAGFGDWYADGGLWEAGAPTSGPGAAHGGSNCVGTVLGGDYPEFVGSPVNGENANGVSSRLVSPAFIVPAAAQNPWLRFWHWFSFNLLDSGWVEIKEIGVTDWVKAGQTFSSSGTVWSRGGIDLSGYAGKTVQVAFHFQATNHLDYYTGSTHGVDVSAGWYIDNIEITSDTLVPIPSVYSHPEGTPLNFTAQATGANLILSLAPGAPAGATIHPTTGAFSWTPSEQQGPGVYDITVLVSQTGNNLTPLARSTFTVQVVETNAAPVLNPIGPQTVNEGSPLAFTATATDPDNNNIANPTILASANFDDLTFGTWTAYSAASNRNWGTEDFNGQYAWIFGLGGDVASDDWLISPSLKLDAATLNTLRFQSQREYAGPNLAVLVSTNYNGTGNPTAATWTALAPVLPNADSSTDWTDSGVLDLAAFTGPQVYIAFRYTTTGTTTGNARLWRVDDIEIRGPAAVPPPQTLTYSLGAGAPAGASINPTTGQFTWTPTAGQAPGYPVTIIVTDNGGSPPNQSDSETIQITVQAIGNAAPVLALIPAQTVNEGAMLNFTAAATDANLPPQVLTFSLTGAPSGASIHPTTGVFSWTPTEAQGPGSFNFTVLVSDGELTDDQLVSVAVNEINQAPVLAAIPSTPASSGATISFVATATDADLPANTLAFSLGAGAPAGATIHPTTGLFTWTTPLVRTNLGTTIKIIVTDNGSPALQDDQDVSFTIAGGDDLTFWQRDKFGDEVDNPAKQATVWGDNADPDQDGTGNLLEFMMARNPMVPDENLGPKFRVENGKAIMTYRETKLTDHGVYLFGNWSPDLVLWLSAGLEYVTVSDQGDHNLMEIRMPINTQKRLFQRLEVIRAY